MSYGRRVILIVIAIAFSLSILIAWLHATASDTSSGNVAAPVSASAQAGVTYYQNDFGVVIANRAVPDKQTAKPKQTSLPHNAGDRREVVMAFFAPIMLVGVLAYILSPRNKEWNIYTMW